MSRKDVQNLTPPDMRMRNLVEMAARFVSRHGSEYEKSIMNIKPHDERINFNFLKSSEDPLHGYYKQKLTEYQDDTDTEFIESPASSSIRDLIKTVAHLISRKGLEDEREMMDSFINKPGSFGFLKSSHRHHAFFRKMLTECRSRNQQNGANQGYDAATTDEKVLVKPQDQFIRLPGLMAICLPKGMKIKEFNTMKLTAQFAAWYGNRFWLKLRKIPGFEFTNETDSNFDCFFRFLLEYSKVFTPPKDLGEKMRKSDAYAAAIQDGFFRLLQWDVLQPLEWREGGVMSMVNWHASLEKDFANEEDDEPEPKRQKFDESATLVPEDQFLAQHPGSSTISVSGSNLIDITLQPLSEDVANLKKKIDEGT